jgi:hypothetical protein
MGCSEIGRRSQPRCGLRPILDPQTSVPQLTQQQWQHRPDKAAIPSPPPPPLSCSHSSIPCLDQDQAKGGMGEARESAIYSEARSRRRLGSFAAWQPQTVARTANLLRTGAPRLTLARPIALRGWPAIRISFVEIQGRVDRSSSQSRVRVWYPKSSFRVCFEAC